MDWEALSGIVPFLLWIIFLAMRKKKQRRPPAQEEQPTPARRRPRRSRERDDFQRDYEPLEPS